MSTQLGKLAADASSFYNVPLPEALQAIQSGLVGEAEPMRRFGVLLNAQAVDAEAARLGLEKVGKEYTEGAKAQARASLIMSGMKDATGDLERTQGSLANRIKELKGRAANFAADLGTKLLPVVLTGMDLFERWSGIISARVAPIIKEVGGGIRAFFAAFRDGGNDVTSSGLAGALEKIGIVARNVFDWMKANVLPVLTAVGEFIRANLAPILAGLAAAFGLLIGSAAIGGVVAIIGALVAALSSPIVIIAALVAGVVYAYQRFEVFREVVAAVAGFITNTVLPIIAKFAGYLVDHLGAAVDWVKKMWPQISEAVGHVLTVVRTIIETFVGIVMAVWRAWGDDIFRLVKIAFEYVRGTIDNVLQVIRGVISTVLAIINGDWGRAWDGIKQVFAGIWDQIVNVLRTAIGALGAVAGGIVSAFAEVLRPLGNLLHTWIITPLETIIGFVTGMPGKIGRVAAGMFDGIKNAFRSAINFVIRAWNGLEFKIPGFDPPGPGPSFGGFTIGVPNIPTLHSGGIFRAQTPGGEGLALLKDREHVFAAGAKLPGTGSTFGPGSVVVTVQMPPGASALQAEIATERAVLKALGNIDLLGA